MTGGESEGGNKFDETPLAYAHNGKVTSTISFSIKMMKNYAQTLFHLLDCNIKISQVHMVLKSFL